MLVSPQRGLIAESARCGSSTLASKIDQLQVGLCLYPSRTFDGIAFQAVAIVMDGPRPLVRVSEDPVDPVVRDDQLIHRYISTA